MAVVQGRAAFGSPDEVGAAIRAVPGPKVVVPAFVAGGDVASAHLLSRLGLGGLENSCQTSPLGAVPSIVADLAARLSEVAGDHDDGVILAADGTTGAEERQVVMDVARMLSRRLSSPVQGGYLRTWAPSVSDAVERLRRSGHDRVSVAAWRLVDGPDFDGYKVDFDEAIDRGSMYKAFEAKAREEACNLYKMEVK